MPSRLTQRSGGTSGGNDQGKDEQGAKQQKKPVTKLETPLVLSGDGLEIADGREDDRRRFTPSDQVQEERHPS